MFEDLTAARKEIEPKLFRTIHQEAMRAVDELKSKEALLIRALQEVARANPKAVNLEKTCTSMTQPLN